MLSTLRTTFPVMCVADISRVLGLSRSVICRKARELGLKRDEDFDTYTHEARSRLTSEGIRKHGSRGVIQKGEHRSPQNEFQKGHQRSAEQEARRAKNCSMTMRRLIDEERQRVLRGLPRKTKLNIGKDYIKQEKI